MNKTLRIFILSVILIPTSFLHSFSQKEGYIIANDTLFSGYISFKYSKPEEVQFFIFRHGEPISLTPEDISVFGYDRGMEYLSRPVEINGEKTKEFVEVIVDGRIKLLRSTTKRNIFLIENDSLIQLNDENYKNTIHRLSESCGEDWVDDNFLVKKSLGSLSHFIKQLNEFECNIIPFFNIGFIVEHSFSKLKLFTESFVGNSLGDFGIWDNNFKAGFYVETPVWIIKNVYFLSQLAVTRNVYFTSETATLKTDLITSLIINQDTKVEFTQLSLDLSWKYAVDWKKIRPYLIGGPSFNFLLSQDNDSFKAIFLRNTVSFQQNPDFVKFPRGQIGFLLGGGLQYFYTYDHYISIEIKHYRYFDGDIVNKINELNNINIGIRANL